MQLPGQFHPRPISHANCWVLWPNTAQPAKAWLSYTPKDVVALPSFGFGVCWYVLLASPMSPISHLTFLCMHGCYSLVHPVLLPDSAHTHTTGCCCFAQPNSAPALAALLSNNGCSPIEACSHFPYEVFSQPWILHLLGGNVVQPNMAIPSPGTYQWLSWLACTHSGCQVHQLVQHHSSAWPTPKPASCSLNSHIHQWKKYSSKVLSRSWVLHVLTGAVVQSEMALPHSWHLLLEATA